MNQNSEKKPFSTDMPANSIPETNFQPDYNWTASQSAPLVTVSQEEWNEWMRKNMEYRASLNLPWDKHPPKTFTDPSDSHLQDSLKGMGDFYPQDPSTDDPEDSHPQEPTSEPGASHLQDPFSKSGTDAEKFSESVKTGPGQPDSVSPESPESPQLSVEEERSGLSKGVTLLLALIVIQLVIILIILCRKKGIILEDAESVFAFFPNVHHISYYPFSAIREIIS